jgi:hypothetical protein
MKARDKRTGDKGRLRTMGRWALCAMLGAALAGLPAAAQQAGGDKVPWREHADGAGLPSEDTAFTLSVVGTVAAGLSPICGRYLGWTALIPLFAGPSLGAIYGGCWGRALLFTGLRLAGTFAAAAALFDDDFGSDGAAYAWIGGMVLSAVIETATIKAAVRKHNRAVLNRRGVKFDAVPFALPKGGGIQIRLSF